MQEHLLYSTNAYMKLMIQERYRGDLHYVWCGDCFDGKRSSAYSSAALVPPSSNPADIYRELRRDVDGRDAHSAKIAAQKASFMSLAVKWFDAGEITSNDRDDIVYMVNNAPFDLWRPLLYVIPRAIVQPRLQLVPLSQRAGFGNEYIIPDLSRSEFDVVEF